jgi:predicted transcriptional regulator
MAPLISEGLLKVDLGESKDNQLGFNITDKGEQFIDFLRLALEYVESQADS